MLENATDALASSKITFLRHGHTLPMELVFGLMMMMMMMMMSALVAATLSVSPGDSEA